MSHTRLCSLVLAALAVFSVPCAVAPGCDGRDAFAPTRGRVPCIGRCAPLSGGGDESELATAPPEPVSRKRASICERGSESDDGKRARRPRESESPVLGEDGSHALDSTPSRPEHKGRNGVVDGTEEASTPGALEGGAAGVCPEDEEIEHMMKLAEDVRAIQREGATMLERRRLSRGDVIELPPPATPRNLGAQETGTGEPPAGVLTHEGETVGISLDENGLLFRVGAGGGLGYVEVGPGGVRAGEEDCTEPGTCLGIDEGLLVTEEKLRALIHQGQRECCPFTLGLLSRVVCARALRQHASARRPAAALGGRGGGRCRRWRKLARGRMRVLVDGLGLLVHVMYTSASCMYVYMYA